MMFKRLVSVSLTVIFALLLSVLSVAQSKDESAASGDIGWTSYIQFAGSSNADGQILQLNSSVGYTFTRHFGADIGIPVYFVHASSSNTSGISGNGVGNPFADLRWKVLNPAVNYLSVLTGSAPLGDSKLGLSTGRATFDWTNHFDHSFAMVTPFVEAGLSNTTADSALFVRPYTTLGMNGHFLGGARIAIWNRVNVGGSLYDIAPFGNQTVFSRVSGTPANSAGSHGRSFQTAQQTTGTAVIARDNGFSAFAIYSPSPIIDAELGYTRSVHYDLNTVSFSLGFNVGRLLRDSK